MSETSRQSLESSIGIDQDTADKVRLFAHGNHVSIQAIYGDILPVVKEFFYKTEKGDFDKHAKEIKAYLRISEQADDMIMNFVEGAVSPTLTSCFAASGSAL